MSTGEKPLLTQPMLNLLRQAEEIELEAARNAGAIGYMAQAMILATLPHRNPGEVNVWARENGNYALVVKSGVVREGGKLVDAGIPFGTKPRLLMAWITTEAVRTQEKVLLLGESLSSFMRGIGLEKITGGKNGSITGLRDQMRRTFTATFSCLYGDGERDAGNQLQIARSYDLWWTPQEADQAGLWRSTLTLNDDFFEEVRRNPVPVDVRALRALRSSSMGLDIYLWLTYRNSYLNKDVRIKWEDLLRQFGSGYAEVRKFRAFFEEQLKKVLVVYPQVRVEATHDCLILKPSPTHIPRLGG